MCVQIQDCLKVFVWHLFEDFIMNLCINLNKNHQAHIQYLPLSVIIMFFNAGMAEGPANLYGCAPLQDVVLSFFRQVDELRGKLLSPVFINGCQNVHFNACVHH